MDNSKKPSTDTSSANTLMHDFNKSGKTPNISMKIIVVILLAAILGLGTGYVVAGSQPKPISGETLKNASQIEKGQKYGSNDRQTFKDDAEGVVKEGGIEGEGAFSLERAGGPSQTVAMTSSTVDLSLFIDRKVKVWGKTEKAQKAAWLMDVGQVEVLE